MAAQLRFAKLHLNNQQDFWNNVFWTDETKVELFGHNTQQHVWWKHSISAQTPQTSCQARWWRADGLGLFCSHGTLQSPWNPLYQSILESNVRPPVWQLKLVWNWVTDSDAKTQQQAYNRKPEKGKNQDAAVVQSKSRPQPDWNAESWA